jgi:hypothetical protein
MPTGERLMSSRDARGSAIKEMIVFCLFISGGFANNSVTKIFDSRQSFLLIQTSLRELVTYRTRLASSHWCPNPSASFVL